MAKKQYAILGLGIFGSTISKTLSEYGADIIAIDKDITNVERVDPFVTQAVQADFTDIEQLKDIGVGDVDVAVVATGSRLEESIMAIMHLRELGVPYILAKAKNKAYMQVLLKIGADKVVRPEKEMGERVAKSLLSRNVIDLIDVDDEFCMVEIRAPHKWIGSSIKDLNLRVNYGINLIGHKNGDKDHLRLNISPDYIVEEQDRFLIIAETETFEKHEYLGKL